MQRRSYTKQTLWYFTLKNIVQYPRLNDLLKKVLLYLAPRIVQHGILWLCFGSGSGHVFPFVFGLAELHPDRVDLFTQLVCGLLPGTAGFGHDRRHCASIWPIIGEMDEVVIEVIKHADQIRHDLLGRAPV